ncbi:MAG: tRNA (N6-threonylcarbamoyladenosine(37)-N6)-methyltransferase TrmO, partial [Myxococcota bacterium]
MDPAETARHGLRPHEIAVDVPAAADAGLCFIGRVRTPWTRREDCPRQSRLDGPPCQVEIFEPWVP